jgi:hypothetical protein
VVLSEALEGLLVQAKLAQCLQCTAGAGQGRAGAGQGRGRADACQQVAAVDVPVAVHAGTVKTAVVVEGSC